MCNKQLTLQCVTTVGDCLLQCQGTTGVSPGAPFPLWVGHLNYVLGDQSIFKLCLVDKTSACLHVTTRVTPCFIGGYII